MAESVLQEVLTDLEPLGGKVLDLAVTELTQNKAAILASVDTEAGDLDSQIATAITTGLKKAGGILGTLSGLIAPELTTVLANLTSEGETDLSSLYDKGVAWLSAEAKALGG